MSKCRNLFIIFFIAYFALPGRLCAQYENIWVFGQGAGLDFMNGNPVPIQTAMESFGEASASVCDHNGALLFYTEGSYIWDRNGNLMPNGSDLTPFTAPVQPVTGSSSQGALIIPYPGQDNLYFVFSITDLEMAANFGRLYYSIVDMNLNGGMGDVVAGSKGIFVGNNITECMTAVVGDRCNVWLITHATLSQEFRVYELSSSGLNTTPVISPANGTGGTGGYLVFSSDRKRLAVGTAGSYGIILYDFDCGSGTASNPIALQPFAGCAAVAFSPDNNKLYAIVNSNLYQYDISSGNANTISNSEVILNNSGSMVSHLKLAPNGKIYFRTPLFVDRLGVINNPNLAGTSCGLATTAITLLSGTSMNVGFPNVVPVILRDTFFTHQQYAAPCFAQHVAVNAQNDSSGWGYNWNTGGSGPVATADSPGLYRVTYHSPPCNFHTDTIEVSFPNGRLPWLHIDTTCANTANGLAYAYTYMGDTVHYSYTWMNTAGDTLSVTDTLKHVASGNYTVYIHTAQCDTLLSLFVPETEYHVSFASDSIICISEALLVQNTSASHFTGFQWSFGDGGGSLAANPQPHSFTQHGRYEVVLTGTGPVCKDTFRATIIVDPVLAGAFLSQPDSICMGRTINFLPQTDSTATMLHWQWGDGTEMTTPDEPTVHHAYDSAGTIPVQLTTEFRACPNTAFTDTVYVYAPPLVYLGPDTGMCLGGEPVFLKNLRPEPATIYRYLWNSGDTTASLKVVHPGIYSLTVSNEPLGCSTTETVEIHKDCYVDIPNAFTPNGDGANDYFYPRQLLSKGVTSFQMQIFNRWGQLVFESMKTDGRGWDGRFNNADQPGGVYIYLVDIGFKNGRMEKYQGNVTLVR